MVLGVLVVLGVLLVLVVRRGALLIHVLWLVLWLLLTVRIKIVQLGTLKRRLEQSWIIVLGMLGGEICILRILVVLVRICLLMVRIVVLGRVIVVRVVCLGDISRWRVFEVFVRTQRCIEAGWVVDGNVSDVADCAGYAESWICLFWMVKRVFWLVETVISGGNWVRMAKNANKSQKAKKTAIFANFRSQDMGGSGPTLPMLIHTLFRTSHFLKTILHFTLYIYSTNFTLINNI